MTQSQKLDVLIAAVSQLVDLQTKSSVVEVKESKKAKRQTATKGEKPPIPVFDDDDVRRVPKGESYVVSGPVEHGKLKCFEVRGILQDDKAAQALARSLWKLCFPNQKQALRWNRPSKSWLVVAKCDDHGGFTEAQVKFAFRSA